MASSDGNTQAARSKTGLTVDGRFAIRELLRDGPLGELYRAEDLESGDAVELRILHSPWLDELSFWELSDLVENQTAVVRKLRHPNIDPLLGSGVVEGQAYLAFAGDSSFTLRSLLNEPDGLPLATVREVATQVLKALAEAHTAGIHHYDLRPENVLLTVDSGGQRLVRVRGFGSAELISGKENSLSLMTKSAQTVSGPEYMSPELFTGAEADERSDLYSFGIILYEMLEGSVPFKNDSLIDMLLQHLHEPVPPLSNQATLGGGANAFIASLLAKQRSERPKSAAASLARLAELFGRKDGEKSVPAVSAAGGRVLPAAAVGSTAESPGQAEEAAHSSEDDSEESSAGFWSNRVWLMRGIFAALCLNCVLLLAVLISISKQRAQMQSRHGIVSASASASAPAPAPAPAPAEGEESDLPAEKTAAESAKVELSTEQAVEIAELGVRVLAVSAKEMKQRGFLNAAGLLVVHAERGGRAYKAGLRPRDIIQKLETKGESILSWQPLEVRRPEDLTEGMAQAQSENKRLALIIKRGSFDGLVVFLPPGELS